jgi:hypothetical protein
MTFVGVSAYCLYLAMEWYRVVPMRPLWVRFIAPSVALLATCLAYANWLRAARRRPVPNRPAAPSRCRAITDP